MPAKAHIDYTELSITDSANAKAFYAAAFGWTFQDWGPDYIAFNDGKRDAGGMRVEPARKEPLVILYADDLDAVRTQVVAAGGKLLGPELAFPGGRRFHFVDPAGNELAVWTKV